MSVPAKKDVSIKKETRPESPRIPAYIEAEKHALGQALLQPEFAGFLFQSLQPPDFYEEAHQRIYAVMLKLHEDSRPVETIDLIESPDLFDMAGYVSALADNIPFGNPKQWVARILEMSQLRQVWSLTQKTAEHIGKNSDLEKCLDYIESGLRKIRARSANLAIDNADIWRADLEWIYDKTTGKRKLNGDRINFMRVLANDQRIAPCFAFDELKQDVVCVMPPPWNDGKLRGLLGDTKKGQLHDEDYSRLAMWLESEFGACPTRDILGEIVFTHAQKRPHHPVKNYLDTLAWDGIPRLDTWLRDYLGSPQNPQYLALVGAKWMISAVARIYKPGCKADHVLILEGAQGLGKSSALKALATIPETANSGGCFFSDTPIHLDQPKDAYLAIQGQWIVELAELDTLIRVEDATAKAFFTSGVDRFRPPYMRSSRDFPRQCVFAGTVNASDYLRDATGGRRYWPVDCRYILHAELERDRDQLWAEAVARYNAGEKWHPQTEQERGLCGSEQAERRQDDPWLQIVATWISHQASGFTSLDILTDAIGIPRERCGRKEDMRVSNIMSQFPGWKKARLNREGRPRGYERDT